MGERGRAVRRWVRGNSLGLFFLGIFALALVGQAIAGHALVEEERAAQGLGGVSFARYLTSSNFASDVAENWQSEYLQFFLYIFGTVWLVQQGSPESKELRKVGVESDADQQVGEFAGPHSPRLARRRDLAGWVYARSLGLVMGVIFLLSWLAQSVSGVVAFNEQRLGDLRPPLTWVEYLVSPDFWSRTLQNWQSEFLAVASMAILAIYLRQRGSPESKPVGAAHDDTGIVG